MKVYIDDKRKAPEGWIQVFNANDAIEFIIENYDVITHIDFDYYLSKTNTLDTGMKVINYLINYQKRYSRTIFHSPQENYTFHSSDYDMNKEMYNAIASLFDKALEPVYVKPNMTQLQKLRNSKGRR